MAAAAATEWDWDDSVVLSGESWRQRRSSEGGRAHRWAQQWERADVATRERMGRVEMMRRRMSSGRRLMTSARSNSMCLAAVAAMMRSDQEREKVKYINLIQFLFIFLKEKVSIIFLIN